MEHVPSKYFKILLKYLVDLKGGLRDHLKKSATEMVEDNTKIKAIFTDIEKKIDGDEQQEQITALKLKRIEKVLEVLQE